MSTLSQVQMTLSLKTPNAYSLSDLEEWLFTSGFQFERDSFLTDFEGVHLDSLSNEESLAYYVRYWLFFHQHLLIEAGIPAFKATEIVSIKVNANQHDQLTLVLHCFPDFQSAVVKSLSQTLSFITRMNATPFSWRAFETLSETVHQQVYLPLKKISNAGVSNRHIIGYACREGIPIQYFGAGLYKLGWGANSHLLMKSTTEQDSAIGSTLSGYKHFTSQRLAQMGLPAPQNQLVDNYEKALKVASEIGYPVVIKPEQGNRTEGVETDIHTPEQLKQAFEAAKCFNPLVLVEKQVTGTWYRLFVYKESVVFVVSALPRAIKGDGKSNIRELLELDEQSQRQRRPWQRFPRITLDDETLYCLNAQGLTADSVPKKDQTVFVRKILSVIWGVSTAPRVEEVHPDNIRLAVDATKAVHLTTSGVDILIEDIAKPWYEQECIINEINATPMIGSSQVAIEGIPKLMSLMIKGSGRIPVEVYMGQQQALVKAKQAQKERIIKGEQCYLTSHNLTYDAQANQKPMCHQSLERRVQALLMNQEVASLILVVQTDQLLSSDLPIDQICCLEVSDEPLEQLSKDDGQASQRKEALVEYFQTLLKVT